MRHETEQHRAETCYKAFGRDVIQSIDIEENRFGFEPEIVAKVAQRRLNVYEMGVPLHWRYVRRRQEDRDARWLASAVVNPVSFVLFVQKDAQVEVAAPLAFLLMAAALNYYLSILFVFRHRA